MCINNFNQLHKWVKLIPSRQHHMQSISEMQKKLPAAVEAEVTPFQCVNRNQIGHLCLVCEAEAEH